MTEQTPPQQSPPIEASLEDTAGEQGQSSPYRVLARKYRPADFAGLIGQQAMVRTLTNAIGSGRLAHAFILTGVRGVGKTTTARIIARMLNCTGPDNQPDWGPTAEPCGVCEHCRAISADRSLDVLEMDAASRTGIDDIRELIEGVRYRPTSARYKVYIIDEVHMLSKNAFNALLKTLEEPPEHVKFIFATTEIRKVPVTVLSRCQRFDLRRVDGETLAAHFSAIAAQEGAELSSPALHLIAGAADGSVRDGLSLLDHAIAHCSGSIGEEQVRRMLGLADRSQTFDLFEAAMGGDIPGALAQMDRQYRDGADPAVVIGDMLELTHWLTRVKVDPSLAESLGVPEMESVRGRKMAAGLSMAALARAWQMLLKGLGEARQAPRPEQAAEMILVRLAYAADLPTPAEAVRSSPGGEAAGEAAPAPPPPPQETPRSVLAGSEAVATAPVPVPAAVPEPDPTPPAETPDPISLQDVVDLADRNRQAILRANLINNLHLVHFEPGRIEFRPTENAPADLAHDLTNFLNQHTARRWIVTVSGEPGEPTLHQRLEGQAAAARTRVGEHPLVKEILETFPGAEIETVREVGDGEDGE